jgi:peptide-methionine (S)-S-oxide reductase
MRGRKTLKLIMLLVSFLLAACGGQNLDSKGGFTVMPVPKPGESVATFAGGCFWATQECMLQLKGVNTVISGYSGGTKANPSYDEVLTQSTGHAEAVQVYYDPKVISFKQLTSAFFNSHDPTQINRQGPDVGTDYRSIAFFRNPSERKTILNIINAIDSSGTYAHHVATEIVPN